MGVQNNTMDVRLGGRGSPETGMSLNYRKGVILHMMCARDSPAGLASHAGQRVQCELPSARSVEETRNPARGAGKFARGALWVVATTQPDLSSLDLRKHALNSINT
jgi:hypothetical protein